MSKDHPCERALCPANLLYPERDKFYPKLLNPHEVQELQACNKGRVIHWKA